MPALWEVWLYRVFCWIETFAWVGLGWVASTSLYAKTAAWLRRFDSNFATSAVSLCLDAGPNNPEFHALATAMERPFLNTKFSFRAIS